MSRKEKRYRVSYSYMISIFTHYGYGEVWAENAQDAMSKARNAYQGFGHFVTETGDTRNVA